jgi:hypothetical protein
MNELPLALAKIGVNAKVAASNHAGLQKLKGLIVYRLLPPIFESDVGIGG